MVVRDVSYRYPGGRGVLKHVSSTFEEGRVTCVLGPNGSKTALLKLLAEILKPIQGCVSIYGEYPKPENVAFVMQNPEHMFAARSVLEDIALSLRSASKSCGEVKETALSLLRRYGLEEYANKSPFELSQGERPLLSLLLMAVLDRREPTFGLDRRYSGMVARELVRLAKAGKTVIVATHDTWLVTAIANKVVVLEDGRVLFEGDVAEFLSQPRLMAEACFAPHHYLRH